MHKGKRPEFLAGLPVGATHWIETTAGDWKRDMRMWKSTAIRIGCPVSVSVYRAIGSNTDDVRILLCIRRSNQCAT